MNLQAGAILEQAGVYAASFERVSAGGRFDGASSSGPIRLVTDPELLESLGRLTTLSRLVEAERTRIAGEVARRSEAKDDTSLARRMGATCASDLVAQATGMPHAAAGTIVRLGTAIRGSETFTGEPLPSERPHLAAAFEAGRLDPTVAAAINRTMTKCEPGLAIGEARTLEAKLVQLAQEGYSAEKFLEFLKQVPEHAHPEGAEEREKRIRAASSVTKRRLESGITRWVLDLDPLTSGLFETALDANTAIRRFQIRVPGDPVPVEGEHDRRPLKERRVDGLALMAKKVVKVDDGQVAGTAVTLLVTIGLHEFLTGLGAGLVPGTGPISAKTVRMVAVEANIIPVVLGGESQPLDLGAGRRYFSEAQRRAMAARDAGCAGPGCDAPLSWTEGAHIVPAGRGPTSVDNGILLCWHCHQLLDQHGWQVHRADGRWWWTPPPWVDPTGTSRPGGAIRLGAA